jgi:DNA-binding transcriptional LysR family regulator
MRWSDTPTPAHSSTCACGKSIRATSISRRCSIPKGLGRDLALGAELPWIWIPRALTPEYHDQVASCCRAAGFIPQPQHLAQSINSQLVMVASGLGVALVPEDSLRGPLSDSIKTIHLQQTKTIDLAAVWRQSGNRLVADFLEVVLSRRGRGR